MDVRKPTYVFLLTAEVTQICTPPLNNPQRDNSLGHNSDITYGRMFENEHAIRVR
jgi:hypothetical protein